MTNSRTFIRQHPALTFYALAFAISWGGVLMVVGGPGAPEAGGLTGGVYLTLFLIPTRWNDKGADHDPSTDG